LVTETTMNLTWETDRPATGILQWGPTAELGSEARFDTASRLHEATIEELQPGSNYFYKITAFHGDQTIDSGMLTFKTAVKQGQPFRFAVLGDTESRPHINDRIAKRIWAERPNFVVNLGDLTDAGERPHRYEWTHEYFVGMTQLTSRVPMFAVPGNGESDLYWYKHYHHYPAPEGYYAFRFGDAAFLMLDSNQRRSEFAPGGVQYEWLDKQLASCDAKWKFVCHHHATYTGEEDDYGDTWKGESQFGDPFVRKIVPLYEKHGVDIAMFGHLHLYERSHPIRDGKVDVDDGTVHLLIGGGGGNLEDFAPTPAFFSAKTYPDHHYVTMEVIGDTLTVRMHGMDGNIRDTYTIEKGVKENALRVSNEHP
jgi:3',5'-cyclic AMP phosphodiesterase CpdA